MSDMHEGPLTGPLSGAQYDVEARLAGNELAGFGEVAESATEALASQVVLESVRAAEAERGRQRANGEFLVGFVDMLPRYGYERGAQGHKGRGVVYADDLSTVKRVQSSVLWHPLGGANYVVGAKISDKPKFTELLLARPTYFDGKRELNFNRGSVYTEDYRRWKELAPAVLQAEYTHDQIQALTSHGISPFVATEDDPHSIELRNSFLADPKGAADWISTILIRQSLPNFMVKSDVPRRGVRLRRDFGLEPIDPYRISDTDMELFGVFDMVSGIAQKFGKGDELTRQYEVWQAQHGDLVL